MSEEPKNIRLNKAAKELNVGINTLADYLAKKGHPVDISPNTKISSEEYNMLVSAFQSEREVKEIADKIEIVAGNAVTIEANSLTEDKKEENEEIVIKNYNATQSKGSAEKSPSKTEGPSDTTTEKTAPEAEKAQFETKVIRTSVPGTKDGKDAYNAELRIVDKIDLSTLNTKVRPGKKTKEDDVDHHKTSKSKKTDASTSDTPKATAPKTTPAHETTPKVAPAPATETEKISTPASTTESTPAPAAEPVLTPAPVATEKPVKHQKAEPATEPQPAPVATPEPDADTTKGDKVVEFIETQYQKLEGPKVVSKIDLSQFNKPKSHFEGEKHKRKRIKGVKVDEKAIAENTTHNAKGPNKDASGQKQGQGQDRRQGQGQGNQGQRPGQRQGQNQTPNANSNQQRNKDKAKGKPVKGKVKEKVEVDDAEIEKQIRDTLARLSPMGKSKTSKHNREKRQKVHQKSEAEMMREMESQKTLQVTEFVTANELATMMDVPVTKIISTCMSVGIFVSINQRLDAEAIQLIADEFGFEINFVSHDVVDAIHDIEENDNPDDLTPRNPIVTVMGHVDHGKTSLLDYIRKTNVIAGEAGGITQHIGAYEVTTAGGRKITFLDTPGHEAFTAMRARGAKVTDIAIIVIAADDKIMPQTIEAINHAQAAAVPIVFAINKIDKPGADPDRIKTELANMNLLVEEWGGKYQSQDISAKKGINVEQLLEKVLLEAEMLELKGNPNKRAKGTVLESSLDKGRGYVAKLLIEDGSIHQGDPILAGATFGRVKAMYNERNQLVTEAGPSQPVLLLGLNGAPQAGDLFNVMENEKEAKDIANKRQQLQREQGIRTQKHITLDEIGRRIAIGDFKELNIIVKGDVDGSVEALSDSLLKLSNEEVQVNVIHKAVGQITEGDILLAEASNAIIIGFQVRPSLQARKMAEAEQIDIRLYSIIYDAINELKDAIEGMLSPERQEKIVANLEIRETFKITKVGTIAGCMCLDGKIGRNHNVRIIRDGIVVYTGKLASLKRFKDDVKEVVSGQDCGLNIENFNDIKVGDIVEAYEVIEVKRTLK